MAKRSRKGEKERIPAWKSWDECLKYCARKKDNFYSWAFLAEAWLGMTIAETVAEYAGSKSGTRQLQTGRGWEAWQKVYGQINSSQWGEILMSFQRYGNCDTPEAEWIDGAWGLAGTEDKYGDPLLDADELDRVLQTKGVKSDEAKAVMLNALKRYAEWLEAIVHCQVHRQAAVTPMILQPSPEKRELVDLGLAQAAYGALNAHGKQWWDFRHGELARDFCGRPEWKLIGKAQSLEAWGVQKHPEVDALAILFWPLLLRYGWTDRDLMGMLRQFVQHPEAYPLREDREFADYRKKALGLAKTGESRAKSAPDVKPAGWQVAFAMAGKLPSGKSSE